MLNSTQSCSHCQGELIDQGSEIICSQCGQIAEEISYVKDHHYEETPKYFTQEMAKSKQLFALKFYNVDDTRKKTIKKYIDKFSRNVHTPEHLKAEMQSAAMSLANSDTNLKKNLKGICAGVFYKFQKKNDPAINLEDISEITETSKQRILKHSKRVEKELNGERNELGDPTIEENLISHLEQILNSLTIIDIFKSKKGVFPMLAKVKTNSQRGNDSMGPTTETFSESQSLQKLRDKVKEQCKTLLKIDAVKMFCIGKKPRNIAVALLGIVFENLDIPVSKKTLASHSGTQSGTSLSSVFRITADLQNLIYAEFQKQQNTKPIKAKSEDSKSSEEISNTDCSENSYKGSINTKQLRKAIKFLTKASFRKKNLELMQSNS